MIHELATPTVDMNALPGVLGPSFAGSPGLCPGQAGQAHSATYCSSTPRIQARAVRLRQIHELSGLAMLIAVRKSESSYPGDMLYEDFSEQEV
jgi:hypothetical protein